MTAKRNLDIINRRKSYNSKFDYFCDLSELDRLAVLQRAVLLLKPGSYTLAQDRANSLIDEIDPLIGIMVAVSINEKILRGLSVIYPEKIIANFTLGLQEFTVTKKRKYSFLGVGFRVAGRD